MSMEELEKLLTRKERLFVEEYDRDGNGTQAAIRAGYSPGKKNASAAAVCLLPPLLPLPWYGSWAAATGRWAMLSSI